MRLFVKTVFLSVVILAQVVVADDLSANAIAQQYFERHRGWQTLTAKLHMTLSRGDDVATRDLEVLLLESENTGERGWVRVVRPVDLKGTTVLTYTHDTGSDEQWIYLPAIRRVKRLTLESKGGAFLSSQFTFEDLSPFQVQKYTYKRLADEQFQGEHCFVLESTPVQGSSVYSRLVNWIAKDDFRLLKTQFYGVDNYVQKTLTIEQHALYRDNYQRPVRLKMVDEVNGNTTVSEWSELEYDPRLSERDFDVTQLKRRGF